MSRTERWWGRVETDDPSLVDCPLCRVTGLRLLVNGTLPDHNRLPYTRCLGAGRSLDFANDLAALRLRAHP
jgi:hypothetical protein